MEVFVETAALNYEESLKIGLRKRLPFSGNSYLRLHKNAPMSEKRFRPFGQARPLGRKRGT